MATEADVRERVAETFKEEKDREMLTEASNVVVEKSEGIAEPLPKFEAQVTKGVIEVNGKNTEGEFIYESPLVTKVADEQILSPPELNEDAVVLNQTETKFLESSVGKESEKNRDEIISTINENSTEEIQHISKETSTGSSQIAEGKFFEPDLAEEMNVLEPASSKEDVGEVTISEESLGHTISKESENVNTDLEEMKSRGDMKDEDSNNETILSDATGNANLKSENANDQKEEATEICENGNRNLDISSTVTPVEEKCIADAGSDNTFSEAIGSSDALENEHIVEAEASTGKPLSSSAVEPKYVTHHTEAKPDTEVSLASTEASDRSKVADEVQTEVEEPGKLKDDENFTDSETIQINREEPSYASPDKIDVSESCQNTETTTTVENLPEALQEATNDETLDAHYTPKKQTEDISTDDLKKEDDDILSNTVQDLQSTHPLVDETKHEQVFEENQVHITEPTDVRDAHEANSIPECSTIVQTLAEGESGLQKDEPSTLKLRFESLNEVQDESAIAGKDKECEAEETSEVQEIPSSDSQSIENDKSIETGAETTFTDDHSLSLQTSNKDVDNVSKEYSEASHVESEKVEKILEPATEVHYEIEESGTKGESIEAAVPESGVEKIPNKETNEANGATESYISSEKNISTVDLNETPNAMEKTIHESETNVDLSSVASSEKACSHKEESNTPELRFTSFEEIGDESGIEAKEQENEAEETSEVQFERSVPEIQVSECQSVGNDKSVENGAEKTSTDEQSLISESSKKDDEDLAISYSTENAVLPEEAGTEYTEASDRSKVADEIQTEVEEPGKLKDDVNFLDSETIQINPEEPLYASLNKIDVSETCQNTETTTTVVNLPEALKEATKDETLDAHYTPEKQTEDISTDDLKKEDDDIPSNTIPDLRSTHPLVDETKQERVFEENQVHITEPTQVHDAHDANSLPECNTIVQTSDKESLNEMQDERAIEAKDKECEVEETSEVQPGQYVHEIPSSDSQSIENDKSVETGAETTLTDDHSLSLQISNKDVDNVGKEYSEASHVESEKVEKIPNKETNEANGTTENYISSEKIISTVDLNDDENGDISYNTAKDVHSTPPHEQVVEENQVLIEEPKHDAREAIIIPESSTFGQTCAEEASEMELTSTIQTDADEIETESKLHFTEKLQIEAENNTEEKIQKPGEAFEEHERETPNAMENTIHESETNVDSSSVASSEKACSHKEESSTPELRFKSFEEIQDESGIEAKEKESEAEETSEVQLERSVPEIQVSECQSVGNDESVENGASLILESSKKDVEDLAISYSTENEVLPGKEYTEASHAETEHLEKILDRATPVLYSDYEADESGIKEESLEPATTEIRVEKIRNEEKDEAKGTTESYISSEKNITTVDLNDEEDVDTPCYTPKDIKSTIPPVEETKQEQVREENEVPIEELKHVHDVHEAISIPESSTIEQTLAKGESGTDLTSTRQVDADNLEEEFKLNSTEKLQTDAENNTEHQLRQHGEASEAQGHETGNVVENTTHESETTSDARSVTISEKAGLEEASLKKEESSTSELPFKSFEEIKDGSGTEVKEREYEAEETSEVQPPQDVHETQFSDSQLIENDKSVETVAEKTFTDDKCLSAESSKKNDDELTIPYPTEKEILPEEVGKEFDEAPPVESVTRVHHSEVPSELKESEMKEELLEAATPEKAITEEELPSITTHVLSDTAKSDDQCEVSKDQEVLSSEVVSLHPNKDIEVNDREYSVEEKSQAHNPNISDSSLVDIPGAKGLENSVSEADHEGLLHKSTNESVISEISNKEVAITADNNSSESLIDNEKADTKPVETACEEKEATEKSLPTVKADDKELETDVAKDEEKESEVQKGEYSASEVTPLIEDQTSDSFELARSIKNEEAVEKIEDQATEFFEAARNDNNVEVTEHNEDQAKVVATSDSETNREESDSPSSITEGEDPKIHDRDVKLENLSPPDQSNTDICQIDEHLDLATPTEIAPDSIELQNASLATKETGILEEPQTIESIEVTTISAGKDVELLQKDPEATIIHDEVQKPKTENETDAASEIATVESEAKDASDEIKEMEEESSIKQAPYSEPDLTQGSINTTLSVAEERETLDQLPEDHVPEHVHLVQNDSSESTEPVISSEEKDTLLEQPVPVTGTVTREIEAENIECGEEQKTIHDYNQIPESSQPTDSTESAPSNLLQRSADETIQKVEDIVSETLPPSHLLPSHDQKEPEADPKVTINPENSMNDKDVPSMVVQAGGEISNCAEQSFEVTKSEEEQSTKDEMNEATVQPLPAEETNTAPPEEETVEIIEHTNERSEQIAKNEAKDEEEEKSCSEVPLIAEVEKKEDSSSVVLDGKISEQVYTAESIETVISSEDKHIQSDSGAGTVGLEIDESKHADSSEAAGSNKSEEAKENYEDQTSDSYELARSNKNEEAIEKIEDQATEIFEAAEHNEDQATVVATGDSETKRDESESPSSITEEKDPKIHDRDVKLENLSPPDQSNTDVCQIDEHLDLATPTEVAPDSIELQNASLATKETGILEEPQITESAEVTTISADKGVELLQTDSEATVIEDEVQKPKTENYHDAAPEIATVESEAKDASDEVKEMEQETSIKQATDSEPDLTQGSTNTTLSVADEREILDQLPEDNVSEHVPLVEKDSSERIEPVISSEEKDTLLVEPVPVTGTVTREIEEITHANASETEAKAEAENVECGEEQKTIHDYNLIPESSQSTDSTESAPSNLLHGSADVTTQKVDDIVSETLPSSHLLPSHDQKEPEADPKVTTEIVQAGGEISKCVEQSFEETKSEEEEERTKDEMNEATVKSLPAEETNTAAPEEETLEIIERPSERSEQIAKNEELQTENAERDESKDEEEEGKVQSEEKTCSEVPLVAERDLIDGTSNEIIAEVETKEDSSSAVLDGKISEQVDTEERIETVISSEDNHIQSDSVTGTVGLEIDESKRADSSEAAGSKKSEEAKENYEGQAIDSLDAAEINENEGPKENNEDQVTVEAQGSETKQNEDDTQSNITEGDDLKIHVRDVKLENLSPPEQSSTNVCEIDEPLVLAKPTEIAPDTTELDKISLSPKENENPDEPPSSECANVTIASRDIDVQPLQNDVSDAASEAAGIEPEATGTTDESKETEQESTFIETTKNSESDVVQGSENLTLSVGEEKETLAQPVEDNVYLGVQDLKAGTIQKEEHVNLSTDESIREEVNDSRSFEVPANKIQAQKDPEESPEPVLCSGHEAIPRTEEAKGEEVPKVADDINEPATKIADNSATFEEEILVVPENAEKSEDKDVKTNEEQGEVQRGENSGFEVPLVFEKDSVDLTNNKIITSEVEEDNSIVVPEKTIPTQGEPAENTETLISREVPFMVTRAVNLEPAAVTESLECEEDTKATRDYNELPENSKSMEPSKNSTHENLQASAKVTPVEAEVTESQDPESLLVPPHSESSSIENSTKDGASDINITPDKQAPEASPLLASSEHIVLEADQKVTPEPENSECVPQVQQEANSESYQKDPEPANIDEEKKEATEKSLPTETTISTTTLSEKADHFNEEIKVVPEKEELQVKIAETDEKEEGENSGSDAPVIVEASRDIETKVSPKKSNNILSGVGSKVKHSIAKVKKAITGSGKHSHSKESKPTSPK